MKQITPNLYVYEDTCNVYLLRYERKAVLIDFGSGDILKELETAEVDEVTDILMTHHHRDQGQGLSKAAAAGIRIWVPHVEQEFFHSIDHHWQAREVYNNYNVRQDRFSLLCSVPVAGTLKDYARMSFGGFEIEIIPTPGHTTGSISIITEIDGTKVAFSGDLIAAPGKLWSMAALQWTYNGGEGIGLTILSVLDLKERSPQMLLPSHGNPITDPNSAIEQLVAKLNRLLKFRNHNPRLFLFLDNPYSEITPHLLFNRTSMSNSYVLLSQSKKALFIDFGYDFITGIAAGSDRASRRPWLYSLKMLKKNYEVEKIDVAIPTHYHDDHVAGFNLLREVEGTQIWVPEIFAPVFENPASYDLPCLWYDPIGFNRTLPVGQHFSWEEYDFCLYHLPGHTFYAVAIGFEVDGKKVLATGDQYQNDDGLFCNYVYKNCFRSGDFITSAEIYREFGPDLIIPGHWQPFWVKPDYLDEIYRRGVELEQLHQDLLYDNGGLGDEGIESRIIPYQVEVFGGESFEFQVELRVSFSAPTRAVISMVAPPDWQVDHQEIPLEFKNNGLQTVRFQVTPPVGCRVRRERLTVDLTIDGHRIGQKAEALVTVK